MRVEKGAFAVTSSRDLFCIKITYIPRILTMENVRTVRIQCVNAGFKSIAIVILIIN